MEVCVGLISANNLSRIQFNNSITFVLSILNIKSIYKNAAPTHSFLNAGFTQQLCTTERYWYSYSHEK